MSVIEHVEWGAFDNIGNRISCGNSIDFSGLAVASSAARTDDFAGGPSSLGWRLLHPSRQFFSPSKGTSVKKTLLRTSITVIGVIALLATTGCGSQKEPVSAPSPTATPASATPTAASTSTASPTPTRPKVKRHAQWEEGLALTSGMKLPRDWDVSAGWTDSGVTAVFGLKNGLAYVTETTGNIKALTSYDHDSQLIATAKQSAALTAAASASVGAAYAGGKPYLIFAQSGSSIPKAGSTIKATSAVAYSIMDATDGKVVHENVFASADSSPISLVMDGNSVMFSADAADGTNVDYVINPLTGGVDVIPDMPNANHIGTIDGVNIYGRIGGGVIVAVFSASWEIPKSYYKSNDLIGYGKYIAVTDTSGCRIIDVHTGQDSDLSAKLPAGACLGTSSEMRGADGNGVRVYHGVMPIRLSENDRTRTFANEAGTLVTLSVEDSFQPAIIGGDGVIYGWSSVVQNSNAPAKLDLTKGAAESLGEVGMAMPVAASGDGLIAFYDAKATSSGVKYLFLGPSKP